MKPFRLLDNESIAFIHQYLSTYFAVWQSQYTCKLLSFSLEKPDTESNMASLETIHPAVKAEPDWLCLVSFSLFGEDHPVFYPACRRIIAIFFDSPGMQHFPENPWTKDWFYSGSSCLALHMHSENLKTIFYLHPDWVYAQFPHKKALPLVSLDKALSSETITLETCLQPFSIPLQTLLHMEKGDLLQTDQAVSEPFQLICCNHPIATVNPGQTNQQKSIFIEKFL